jgi:hypothetical protein
MIDYNYQVYPTLTILAIGLAFGYMIGMLYYYLRIEELKRDIAKILEKN